jgi:hypothetical protein
LESVARDRHRSFVLGNPARDALPYTELQSIYNF